MGLSHIKLYSVDENGLKITLSQELEAILSPLIAETVTIGSSGLTEMERILVIADVWGCSNSAETDTYATDNLDLKKYSFTALSLTLYNCSTQVITGTSVHLIEIQKNKGVQTLIIADDSFGLFSYSEPDNCLIQKLMIFNGTDKIEGGQTLANKFLAD